jgi:hypothetical protein
MEAPFIPCLDDIDYGIGATAVALGSLSSRSEVVRDGGMLCWIFGCSGPIEHSEFECPGINNPASLTNVLAGGGTGGFGSAASPSVSASLVQANQDPK